MKNLTNKFMVVDLAKLNKMEGQQEEFFRNLDPKEAQFIKVIKKKKKVLLQAKFVKINLRTMKIKPESKFK